MYEYEIVRVARKKEEKTKETVNRKGRNVSEKYTEIETIEEFDARAKKTLNDYAGNGWQVISADYCLPIQGHWQKVCDGGAGWSTTDFDKAEFVVVTQRNK